MRAVAVGDGALRDQVLAAAAAGAAGRAAADGVGIVDRIQLAACRGWIKRGFRRLPAIFVISKLRGIAVGVGQLQQLFINAVAGINRSTPRRGNAGHVPLDVILIGGCLIIGIGDGAQAVVVVIGIGKPGAGNSNCSGTIFLKSHNARVSGRWA